MKRLLSLAAIFSLAAARLCAEDGEPFLAGVLEAGRLQNLRRIVSTDSPPPAQPSRRDFKTSVSLKLPSLGEKKAWRMRVIEVDGASGGVLNFDAPRTESAAPDIDIPGLVSPEILALDRYRLGDIETPSAIFIPPPDRDSRRLDAAPDPWSPPPPPENDMRPTDSPPPMPPVAAIRPPTPLEADDGGNPRLRPPW